MSHPIEYRLDLGDPGAHVFHVTVTLPDALAGAYAFGLPVWSPGDYLIQDFPRHVFDVSATWNGTALAVEHHGKGRWRVAMSHDGTLALSYRVYAQGQGTSKSRLDASHGYWCGPDIFAWVERHTHEPLTLTVVAPQDWHVTTALPPLDGDADRRFVADDYDRLVDSPGECGTHDVYTFTVAGKRHELAVVGRGNLDPPRIVAELERIVAVEAALFGGLPYDRYVFILHLVDRWEDDGHEHANSTVCRAGRFDFSSWEGYKNVLELFAHEFFHLWNVKRIHPAVYGPFDYERERHTTSLWAMEGWTDYYAALFLARAGLITRQDYLARLSAKVALYERAPGRYVQSLAESSFDTWIKFHKPDADSPNRTVSYYLKGELAGLCLDLTLRARTHGQRSLDDVLRELWRRSDGGRQGFLDDAIQAAVEAVSGESWADFFHRYVEGTDELPLDAALATHGLSVQRRHSKVWREDLPPHRAEEPLAWLGLRAAVTPDGNLCVSEVTAPGPAASTLAPGDRILALNRFVVGTPAELDRHLRDHRPGEAVEVTVVRSGRIEFVETVLGERPFDVVTIEPASDPDGELSRLAALWLDSQAEHHGADA